MFYVVVESESNLVGNIYIEQYYDVVLGKRKPSQVQNIFRTVSLKQASTQILYVVSIKSITLICVYM